jgi:predicted Fe-Mo cluster-binding NifX family protein
MKIAVITDDEQTVSRHFGRAPYYLVVTIEGGLITDRQRREKLNHSHFANEHHDHQAGEQHGFSPIEQDRHAQMAEAINDCEVLICGGMGAGAYQSMQARGILPIVTDLESINEAITAYLDGSLIDRIERLH